MSDCCRTEHLPKRFTWKEYLAWAEGIAPLATFTEARNVFDLFWDRRRIVPAYIEHGELTYELR